MIFSDGITVIHGIEGCDFVDAHGRDFDEARDFVHYRNGTEAVLALADVKKRHDGCFFVLRGVTEEDFVYELEICFIELKGD